MVALLLLLQNPEAWVERGGIVAARYSFIRVAAPRDALPVEGEPPDGARVEGFLHDGRIVLP